MFRVADALKAYAPVGITFTNERDADVRVLHVIGNDAIDYAAERKGMEYAVIQYCYLTAGEGQWNGLWDNAKTVMSYYNLPTAKLYRTPLGIDPVFLEDYPKMPRTIGVMTSGYVAGPGAEAIEEVAIAADRLRMKTVHLGPKPVGLTQPLPANWRNLYGVSDDLLAAHYRSTAYVSGLRHVEGFELPVVEGLACGARPIVFDRPEMRRWFDGHAIFVPECSGEELVNHLMAVMVMQPVPVTRAERMKVLQRFNWETIVEGFWERVL